MNANILDMELQSLLYSLTHKKAYMIFFDFKAAFPSVEHDYLLRVLEAIGLGPAILRACAHLYHNNLQRVLLRGKTSKGFLITRGIRQGCPLSPLLFAAVADLLLRRLARKYVDIMLRAFAHDIGLIYDDLKYLLGIFEDFLASLGRRGSTSKCLHCSENACQ